AYNVAAAVIPGLGAWTAYLLCRYLTGALWPALSGGFLFGCSSFVVFHNELGHVGLTAAGALVPLVALVILHFLDRSISGRSLVVALGAVVALELLLSTELAFTTAVAIVTCWALGLALVPERRGRLRAAAKYIVGAYLLAGLVTAPFVYYVLSGFHGTF